ncbi:MAG: hypothetical protein HC849_12860 [Oscillatoriales cyanobacterium RU_3_3]|nr:hypothetical protein [Microcoleus sp. SU_5_3]NJM60887.1 hypothetical protein [Oscillatoriales cyanobacterium RU_3_3]
MTVDSRSLKLFDCWLLARFNLFKGFALGLAESTVRARRRFPSHKKDEKFSQQLRIGFILRCILTC